MQHIYLEPNKELLDPTFNGYKLSLEPVPVHESALPVEVEHILPNDDQYSFLHMRLFSLHNHLFIDQWNNQYVYFFNKHREVVCSVLNKISGNLTGVVKVCQFLDTMPSKPLVNPSLSFVSEELALASDGCKKLYLLHTGLRESDAQSWNVLFEEEIMAEEIGFIILDSQNSRTQREISCVLLSVVDSKSMELRTESSSEDASKFVSFLNVITLAADENQRWALKSKKQLHCTGEIEYAAVEKDLSHLCTISKESLHFSFDSERPVLAEHQAEEPNQNGTKKVEYYWQQTSDDITIWFNIPSDTLSNQISVNVQDSELKVKCVDRVLLQGSLHSSVSENLTTWTLDKNKLEVNLSKYELGLMWPCVIRNNLNGEEIMDPELVQEIHERLAHLCSETEVKAKDIGDMCAPTFNMDQLEECDAISNDSRLLSRINTSSHAFTHQASLSGSKWLFNGFVSPDQGQGFCLRHDVDGCFWIPKADSNSGWKCEHIATFLALGYVQASKQQKKFIVCPPDFSYAAICETTRHVYLYKQSCSVSSELRNRKTGSRIGAVAKQHLINLPSSEEVLGVQANEKSLFVLTTAHLYSLNIV
nr:PREDICTED: nudC domain-containing protein 1 [Bemisia tabaci]XP_018899757.1 PREDICTED: nudC domain-containing protein 1 [Bemisia tabaci]